MIGNPTTLDDVLRETYAQHKELYKDYTARKRTLGGPMFDGYIAHEESYLKIIDTYFEQEKRKELERPTKVYDHEYTTEIIRQAYEEHLDRLNDYKERKRILETDNFDTLIEEEQKYVDLIDRYFEEKGKETE